MKGPRNGRPFPAFYLSQDRLVKDGDYPMVVYSCRCSSRSGSLLPRAPGAAETSGGMRKLPRVAEYADYFLAVREKFLFLEDLRSLRSFSSQFARRHCWGPAGRNFCS